MTLAADDVVGLQFFLMDTAKRYVVAIGAIDESDELFASAAALDYALLLASEYADETLDDTAPIAETVRETMSRAAAIALDFIARVLAAPPDIFLDFAERHAVGGGIFEVLGGLRERGVVVSTDIAFRTLTLANDVAERRRAR